MDVSLWREAFFTAGLRDGASMARRGFQYAPGANTEATRSVQPTVAIRSFDALGDDPKVVLLAQGMTACRVGSRQT